MSIDWKNRRSTPPTRVEPRPNSCVHKYWVGGGQSLHRIKCELCSKPYEPTTDGRMRFVKAVHKSEYIAAGYTRPRGPAVYEYTLASLVP